MKDYDVTVVYPIAKVKWLCWIDEKTGEVTKKRKSPKTGTMYDAFYELYKIKMLLKNPNLHIRLLFLELTEYRFLNGWSADGKKGSSRCDRIPKDIFAELRIETLDDYNKFIPDDLISPFTTKDYAKNSNINIKYARLALNILSHVGAVKKVGKLGNSHLYARKNENL